MRIRLVAATALLVFACGSGSGATPTAVVPSPTPGDGPPSASTTEAAASMSTLGDTGETHRDTAAPEPSRGEGDVTLLPDPSAEHTLGDTVTLSGIPDLVGDQANLTVLDAIRRARPDASGAQQYAFLVEIEGLDPDTLPYNLREFALFDDQSFAYQPLHEDQQQPGLEFGDLARGRKVRGWLTFVGPEQSEYLELEYAPTMALEPAYVRVLLP